MVLVPSDLQTPEVVATQAEQIVQTPEMQKAGVLAQTRQTVDRFAGVFGLTAALTTIPAMATESPYVPLADASGKTQLVLKEDIQGKEELFAAFDKNNKSQKKEVFNKLSPEYQRKVIAYYQAGQKEQPNEKILLKGVYNLMNLYDNIEIAKRAIAEYNKTGREPSEKSLGLMSFMEYITDAFPSASTFIDIETVTKVDTLINKIYETLIVKSQERIAQWQERIAQWQERIAKLKEDTAKLKEEGKILEALLKAL